MSVVNRMLQDIDRRLGEDGLEAHSPHPDVRTVPPQAKRPARSARGIGLAAVSIAVGAAIAMNWDSWKTPPAASVAAKPEPVAPAARTPPANVASPGSQPVLRGSPGPDPQQSPSAVETFRLSLKLSEAIADAPVVPTAQSGEPAAPATPAAIRKAPMPASAPPRKAEMAAVPAVPAESPKAETPVTAQAPSIAKLAAPPAPPPRNAEFPVRRVAAEETIAVARRLWNSGARDGAIATLEEALAAAEASRNFSAAAPLARELARLEVANHRAAPALELLRRLEGLLRDDADALALRGNAEQRLALHSDAASSYLAALRLRPGEGNWMLGAAISLAAEGKMDEARSWVDRARESGAITPTIATYLRQLGIAPRS